MVCSLGRIMARPLRIQYPGAVYHPPSLEACVSAKATTAQDGGTDVMARGNHGQEIFQDDRDRQCFLETLGEACEKTGG